jgi:hypothetical protein
MLIFQKAQKQPTRYFWFLAAFIVILSLVSLLPSMHDSLRIDEPFSANMTNLSWANFFNMFLQDKATPLYYIVLKLWASLFGDSELALRSFSAVCFALTAFLVGMTALQLGGIFAGLAAILLAAMSNVGLIFAGIARPYALLSLLTALSTYLFLIIMGLMHGYSLAGQKRLLLMTGFTAINVLGLLTHPIFIFYMLGCNIAAALKFRQNFWLVSLCNLTTAGIFLVIWGTYSYRSLSLPAVNWMEKPDLGDLVHAYLNIWGVKKTILLVGYILLFCLWNYKAVRNFITSPVGLTSFIILSTIGLLPFVVSQYQVVFNDTRTPALFYPITCVFIGLLLARFKNAGPTFGLLVLLFGYVVAVPVFARGDHGLEKTPKSSIQYAVEHATCSDIFISGGLSITETVYYLRQLDTRNCIENRVFPASVQKHPGWMDPPSLLDHHAALAQEADAVVKDLDQKLGSNGQVWFFYESDDYRQHVLDILRRQLDQKMVLTQTIEGYGSFFDKIYVYIPKH